MFNKSFHGYFYPPVQNIRFIGYVSYCVAALPRLPTCPGWWSRSRPLIGASQFRGLYCTGGTVDLPGLEEEDFWWCDPTPCSQQQPYSSRGST